MSDANTIPPDQSEQDRNHQQVIEYGKDLARIYAVEKDRRKDLETAYLLMDAVFNSIPDGLVVMDHEYFVQQANPAFNNMVTHDGNPSPGLHMGDLPVGPAIIDLVERIGNVSFGSMQTEIVIEQPQRRVLLANIAPVHTGTFDGWVIVLHDRALDG